MALGKRMVEISLRGGVDTKTSTKQLGPDKMRALDNVTFDEAGALTKRAGFKSVAHGADFSAMKNLVAFQKRLLIYGAGATYAVMGPDDLAATVSTANAYDVGLTKRVVGVQATGLTFVDGARGPSYDCNVFYYGAGTDSPPVITERDTGVVVATPALGILGGLVRFDGARFVYVGLTSTGTLIQTTDEDGGNPTTLETLSTLAGSFFDACVVTDGVVAYTYVKVTSGARRVYLGLVTNGVSTYSAVEIHNSASLVSTLRSFVFPFEEGGVRYVRVVAFDSAANTLTAYDRVIADGSVSATTVIDASPSTIGTFYNASGTLEGGTLLGFVQTGPPSFVTWTWTKADGYGQEYPGIAAATKCTDAGYQVLSFLDSVTQTQQYYGLVYWLPDTGALSVFGGYNIVATFAHNTAYYFNVLPGNLQYTEADNTLFCSLVEQRRLVASGEFSSGWATENGPSTFEFDLGANSKQTARMAGLTLLGGGRNVVYDGVNVRDLGFSDFPERIYSLTAGTGAAAGSMSDGTYSYKAVYEFTDATGRVYRSTPSAASSVTLSAGGTTQKVTVALLYPVFFSYSTGAPYASLTVTIALYRTTNGGSVYYRTPLTSGVDTTSDANLTDNQILYTEGGYIDNAWPGACAFQAARRDRLFYVPADDRTAVWYSKPLGEGVGIEFTDGYYVRTETGGDVTGLAVLDDKVLVFKANQVRYFGGDGPNAFGIGEWTPDYLVTDDVGCTDARSIVETQVGVFFLSAKGLYLLDRGLQTVFVGAPVEQLTKGSTITAAVADTHSQRVYFALDQGGLLVYDQFVQQWAQWSGITVKGMAMWNGALTILDHSGGLWKYAEGTFVDGTDGVPLRIETPWYKVSNVAGYQRVWEVDIVGRLSPVTGNDLHVDFLYDYDDTTVVQTVDASQTDGHSGDVLVRIKPSRQKCTAMKMVIRQDATAPDASVVIEGLVLHVGVKQGGAKNRAARL